jgi:hypothetical protein
MEAGLRVDVSCERETVARRILVAGRRVAEGKILPPIVHEWIAKIGSADAEPSLRQARGCRAGLEVDVIGELADLLATDDRRHDLRRLPWFRNIAVVMKEMTR